MKSFRFPPVSKLSVGEGFEESKDLDQEKDKMKVGFSQSKKKEINGTRQRSESYNHKSGGYSPVPNSAGFSNIFKFMKVVKISKEMMGGSPGSKTSVIDAKKGSLFNIKMESIPIVKKTAKGSGFVSSFKKG